MRVRTFGLLDPVSCPVRLVKLYVRVIMRHKITQALLARATIT